ncbi:Rossmann-like and DUF2520 domain-containing protein [Desulfitobacterium metallireducens]|uniref:NAD-dependent glycerol-3-phosphate dehydrogenase n=1 Tax=Desulfitobacterium metallireducens DSM 15288 TaxID=871968 RepID=W0E4S9_9FIRM|nr:Rossmann-like and DUF2520 domain-containing protein [Desulfitobacterium metallireducens]AHF05742.1 NAD-dependent glycerol-3-phosphate dehydrogenase [Desulfitobacterium metallireducens DSM 15288]
MKFGIIGTGIVGTAIAVRLEEAGYQCLGVATRSAASYERFRQYLNKERIPLEEWVPEADLIFITTQDGMIQSVAKNLAERRLYRNGQIWIHCSGSQKAEILKDNSFLPIKTLSMHPIQTFADVGEAIKLLSGSHFGLEGEAIEEGAQIVQDLGGIPHKLDPEKKPLYHAGSVMVSNYIVALADMAVQLFDLAGIPKEAALQSLIPLMQGTLRNLDKVGLPQALTGPIARGDSEVVRSHLECMPLELEQSYRALGISTLELAQTKMKLNGKEYPKENLQKLYQLLVLQGGKK